MALSSHQLEAFVAVARALSFSAAARALHITQSALSQRILNLERELELTLFVRDPAGIRLTEAGMRLLRFCQTKDALEAELLAELASEREGGLGGTLRIAGYSSVMRSVIVPALAPLARANPKVRLELMVRELRELPDMLLRAEADFVVLDHEWNRVGIASVPLGHEEYVLVEGKGAGARSDVYLDHDPQDRTTERFLRSQGEALPRQINRSFLGEIYSLMDGVALGLGRAVVPRHLIRGNPAVRAVRGQGAMRVPVSLHHHELPYYPRLQQEVLKTLAASCPKALD